MLLVNGQCLLTGQKLSLGERPNGSSVAKILLEKITPPREALLNYTVTRKPILPCRRFTNLRRLASFTTIPLHVTIPYLHRWSNTITAILRTQLAKSTETFQLPGPNVLPSLLLNLKSTPFWKSDSGPGDSHWTSCIPPLPLLTHSWKKGIYFHEAKT